MTTNNLHSKDKKKTDKYREKLFIQGPQSLTNSELLAILLRTGTKSMSALKVARSVMNKYPKGQFFNFTYKELRKIKGIGSNKAALLLAAWEFVQRFLPDKKHIPTIKNPSDLLPFIQFFKDKNKEYFVAFYINMRNQLIGQEVVSIGTMDTSIVHPREVFHPAVALSAARVIVAHNHPNGKLEPSTEDIELTSRLKEAGKILGIELLDHIIVGPNGLSSLREQQVF